MRAALILTALLVLIAAALLVLRVRRDQVARREARRQYQRREDTPAVRQLIADAIEEINVEVAAARRRS